MASDPHWVPPLLIDIKARFKKNYPFYEHGRVESFLAYDERGAVAGRCCAIVNQAHNDFQKDNVGFFGFFDCINDRAVAQSLLDRSAEWLKSQGKTAIRGPMCFSTNEEVGVLVAGYDSPPAIMMTHNPPYYDALLTQCGFGKATDLLAYELNEGELSERISSLAAKLQQRLKLTVRPFNKKDFWGEVRRIEQVYNSAWEANWGFVPMTPRELKFMAQTLKLGYDPRLIFFAENERGETVGFSLALPDINVLVKKIDGKLFPTGLFTLLLGKKQIHRARVLALGVAPEYRGRGLDAVLYYNTYKSGTGAGYNWGEFSWILEDNRLMNEAAIAMGSRAYKRWRIYEKEL